MLRTQSRRLVENQKEKKKYLPNFFKKTLVQQIPEITSLIKGGSSIPPFFTESKLLFVLYLCLNLNCSFLVVIFDIFYTFFDSVFILHYNFSLMIRKDKRMIKNTFHMENP